MSELLSHVLKKSDEEGMMIDVFAADVCLLFILTALRVKLKSCDSRRCIFWKQRIKSRQKYIFWSFGR